MSRLELGLQVPWGLAVLRGPCPWLQVDKDGFAEEVAPKER